MPFTPFHLGIGLLIGILSYKRIDFWGLLIGSVILDAWPFSVLIFGLPYSLHGASHSFLIAILVSVVFAFVGYFIYKLFKFKRSFSFLFLGLLIGTFSHVALDAPLYKDMVPFWPSSWNPVFGLYNYNDAVVFSVACFVFAFVLFIIWLYRKDY